MPKNTDTSNVDDAAATGVGRIELTRALLSLDPPRSRVLNHLEKAVESSDARRAALVWVERSDPDLVRVHTLVDLGSNVPRRSFPIDAVLCRPLDARCWNDQAEDGGSLLLIDAGSSRNTEWFLILHCESGREASAESEITLLVTIARDCFKEVMSSKRGEKDMSGFAIVRRESFAAWPMLRDMPKGVLETPGHRRTAHRFMVARVVHSFIEDGLQADVEFRTEYVPDVRSRVLEGFKHHPEAESWGCVLDLIIAGDLPLLAEALLEWGETIEKEGLLHGALELFHYAYDVGAGTGAVPETTDAARFLGRVFRKLAHWDESILWYEGALEITKVAEDRYRYAIALDGLGNTYRRKGNLPKARTLYDQALAIGRKIKKAYPQALAHHNLLTLEKLAGQLNRASLHGLEAVRLYDNEDEKLRALYDLGSVLFEVGEIAASEDAYWIVANASPQFEFRVIASADLAYVSALRGSREEFVARIERLESVRSSGTPSASVEAQVLLQCGLGYKALEQVEDAKEWLTRAVAFSRTHKVNRILFEAEEALRTLVQPKRDSVLLSSEPETMTPNYELAEVRSSLREMRKVCVRI